MVMRNGKKGFYFMQQIKLKNVSPYICMSADPTKKIDVT